MERNSLNLRKTNNKNSIEGKTLKTEEENLLQSAKHNCVSSEYITDV
jgi:hypothetical protein